MITNPWQVSDNLNQFGYAASELWNVGRYYTDQQWDETDEIPDDGELKTELEVGGSSSNCAERIPLGLRAV